MCAAAAPALRTRSSPLTALRIAGALLVGAAGGIHLWLYFDYFHLVHVVGVLFVLNAAAAAVLLVALLASGHPLVVLAGTGFAAATLVFFFLSATVGLFGYVESLGGAWQEAAGGVEGAAIATLAAPLRSALAR